MRQFAASLAGIRQINLLPYHKTGMHKFKRLGLPYEMADVVPPSPQLLADVLERFRAAGLNARIGG
jgi:pyruvate formate lyase activating enzyme